MQTFILKMGCLFLFGFIFFTAYQTNIEPNALSSIETSQQPTTILISNTASSIKTDVTEKAITSPLKYN